MGLVRTIAAAIVFWGMLLAMLSPVPASAGEAVDFDLKPVLSGYREPVFLTAPSSPRRIFIVELGGTIKVAIRETIHSPWVKAGAFLRLSDSITTEVAAGLFGLAFHPGYARNGLFYVSYARKRDAALMVVEYHRRIARRADPTSRRMVLRIPHSSFRTHYGGWMAFGPDNYLYISSGDGGSVGDPAQSGQNLDIRLGKLLRINPLDPDGPGPRRFSVPADNPFVGLPGDDLIWAYGLRNPWGNSFDRSTGDLWVGDVGQSQYEEVDHLAAPAAGKGVNFGWDLCEAAHAYPQSTEPCTAPGSVLPVVELAHDVDGDDNCSVIGGYVHRGLDEPALRGRYFFGDLCSRRVWSVPTDFDMAQGDELGSPLDTTLTIVAFGQDARGDLYVVDIGGTISRIGSISP